jgi:demethylmenaquinone methyltransferase/2-methoxy-6-polyprenyl-1,4-benzoquinol methylase
MLLKQSQIIQGFETIASKYDRANDIMTLGLHRLWRKQLIQNLFYQYKNTPPSSILDLGTGTGDLAIAIAKMFPNTHIFAADPAVTMLSLAKQKAARKLPPHLSKRIQWIHGDLEHLTLPEASFDAIAMAWVIRNIPKASTALIRLRALLRPRGTIHILESGRPCNPLIKPFYPIYSKFFPYLGSLISPDKDFYKYYRQSVDLFPFHHQFVDLLHTCGYQAPKSIPIFGGVVYLYTAQKNP